MSLPPGPRLPAFLQTPLVWSDPQRALDRCRRRYGRAFTLRYAPFGTVVYLADPADVRTVFAGDDATFHAGEGNAVLGPVLGAHSVLLQDGAEHRRSRRLMMPAFHRQAVAAQVDAMSAITAAEVARWPVGREFALAPRMRSITLEVILRVVVGAADPTVLDALRRAVPGVLELGSVETLGLLMRTSGLDRFRLLRRSWPLRRTLRAQAEVDALIHAEVARARRDPELDRRTDVLALLVRTADDSVDDGELRDQVMTLLMAGHETTSTALAWTFERLVRHRAVLARAVEAAHGSGSDADAYLDAVAREALRVRPVIDAVARRLTRPVQLAGHLLPAGVIVAPAMGLVQRADEHFPDAEAFRPERFLGSTASPVTWFPFGGGARRCIGAGFAATEMRVVLREVLRAVELATTDAPGERVRPHHITQVPRHGAVVTATARTSAARR